MAINDIEEGGFRAGVETGPDGESTGNIVCYPSFNPNCIVVRLPRKDAVTSTGFLSLSEPEPFHDDALIKATQEINEVVERLEAKRDPRKGKLHLIMAPDGPMLAWVRTMVSPTDNVAKPSGMKSM